ncbi:MAG: hypothetical protein HY905_20555 [Deltaproteobacteria bacterium]|nr:hypothetical protein [Deltaproteobacteria bacterium]
MDQPDGTKLTLHGTFRFTADGLDYVIGPVGPNGAVANGIHYVGTRTGDPDRAWSPPPAAP